MSGASPPHSLWQAFDAAITGLGAAGPAPGVLLVDRPASDYIPTFRAAHSDRVWASGGATDGWAAQAAERADADHPVFVLTSAGRAAGSSYRAIRDALTRPGAPVVIVADEREPEGPPFLEDVGILRALPGLVVAVPADGPSVGSAVPALNALHGPAYLRLCSRPLLDVTDGSFAVGRAAERRAGTDLTIVAVGALLERALTVADELARVGVATRVLDFASVKPFDEPSLLRAARDTGALLVAEEHTIPTGVGALVAATTAENYPVPVRTVGVPDLYVTMEGGDDPLARYGLGVERLRDEAWELLRLRGKVT